MGSAADGHGDENLRLPVRGGCTSEEVRSGCAGTGSADVGGKALTFDTGDGAGLVVLGPVSADADGADDLAVLVPDEHAAAGRRDAPLGDRGEGGEERGVAGGVP